MKIKIFIIMLFFFFFSGCYNYHELDQLAITSAIGVDKGEDYKYKVTVQVLNTKKSAKEAASSELPDFIIYDAEADTIQEALRKIILESSRRIYANHIQIMVIGDEVARDGIYDILDLFFRNSESRKQFQVIVAKDNNANDILSVLTPGETLSAQNINDTIKIDNRYFGVNEIITFEQMVSDYMSSTKEIVLPTVSIVGNIDKKKRKKNIEKTEAKTKLFNNSMAIFKDDKLIDYLSIDDSILLNFIRGKINNTIITCKCDEDFVVAEAFNTKESLNVDDNLNVKIQIKANLNLNEVNCDIDLEDSKEIEKLELDLESTLKNDLDNFLVNTIDEYNTDIFGIRDNLYKNYPKFYKEIKNDWYNEYFNKLNFDIDVDFKILEKGNALRVIK